MDTAFAATLLAILEERSIIGAARRMGVTSGAVALRIKALERELGTPLIGRAGRAIVPTPAAYRLARPLAEIVACTADLHQIAKGGGGLAGELRLGTIATASTGILPELVARLLREHPAIDLIVEPGTSIELCEKVREGTLDAAVVVEPPSALGKGEMFARWIEEPLIMIVPRTLAGSDPVSLLGSAPFIRYDRRGWGGQLVDGWLRAQGLTVRSRIELDALDGIEAMVAAGVGVAIIPDWWGRRPAGSSVAALDLPPPITTRKIGLYNRRLSRRQELVDLLTPAFQTGRKARGEDDT